MNSDFLIKIVAHKKELVERKRVSYAALKRNLSKASYSRYGLFRKAISKPGQLNLIAEIKKASPSKGLICRDFDAIKLARIYSKGGAQALSILTEEKFFLGNPDYVRQVSADFRLPILVKDFIIDEIQIYEALHLGASAILLIVAILDDDTLKHLLKIASGLDLDCLVEVHDNQELDRALAAGAEIIGVNNRDLRNFEVDLRLSETLIPKIPKDKVAVAESGINSHEDIVRLKEAGAHAVLIGETFLRTDDIGAKIREVMQGSS